MRIVSPLPAATDIARSLMKARSGGVSAQGTTSTQSSASCSSAFGPAPHLRAYATKCVALNAP